MILMPSKSNNLDREKLNVIIAPNRVSLINGISSSRKMLHEDIEIKYFYEGASTLLIGTQTLTARAGDVVIINPYEFHATIDCDEERGKYHLFMIPLDFFSGGGVDSLELRSLLLAKRQSFKTLFSGDKRMTDILQRIVDEYLEKNTAYHIAIRGLLTELFAILLRGGLVSGGTASNTNEILHLYELIEPSLNYIRNNYANEITLEELAQLCNISKYYFCRIFKEVTEKTAMEYLRDYRIEIADIMLVNTDRSVTEISELCGFDDVNYFCRCYKTRYGVSPGKRKTKIKE